MEFSNKMLFYSHEMLLKFTVSTSPKEEPHCKTLEPLWSTTEKDLPFLDAFAFFRVVPEVCQANGLL